MRRLAAVLLAAVLLVGLVGLPGLAAPAAGAPTTAAAEQHDEPPQDDRGPHERPKPLTARSILLTLAVITGCGFAVVLAGLGYFSPGGGRG